MDQHTHNRSVENAFLNVFVKLFNILILLQMVLVGYLQYDYLYNSTETGDVVDTTSVSTAITMFQYILFVIPVIIRLLHLYLIYRYLHNCFKVFRNEAVASSQDLEKGEQEKKQDTAGLYDIEFTEFLTKSFPLWMILAMEFLMRNVSSLNGLGEYISIGVALDGSLMKATEILSQISDYGCVGVTCGSFFIFGVCELMELNEARKRRGSTKGGDYKVAFVI